MDRSQIIVLNAEEAIVLFEFLSRFTSEEALEIKDPSEEKVLWSILAQLEKTLVEPFSENWSEILNLARKKVEAEN